MTPNGSRMGVQKNFKLLKYENIMYSFEAHFEYVITFANTVRNFAKFVFGCISSNLSI